MLLLTPTLINTKQLPFWALVKDPALCEASQAWCGLIFITPVWSYSQCLYKWWTWGSEHIGGFPKVTVTLSGKTGVWTQVVICKAGAHNLLSCFHTVFFLSSHYIQGGWHLEWASLDLLHSLEAIITAFLLSRFPNLDSFIDPSKLVCVIVHKRKVSHRTNM